MSSNNEGPSNRKKNVFLGPSGPRYLGQTSILNRTIQCFTAFSIAPNSASFSKIWVVFHVLVLLLRGDCSVCFFQVLSCTFSHVFPAETLSDSTILLLAQECSTVVPIEKPAMSNGVQQLLKCGSGC